MGLANAGLSTPQQYAAIQQYLDVPNLIDYMLLNFYGGNQDWDDHNWYAAPANTGGRLQILRWDSEAHAGEITGDDRTGVNQADKPSKLYGSLRANPDFVIAVCRSGVYAPVQRRCPFAASNGARFSGAASTKSMRRSSARPPAGATSCGRPLTRAMSNGMPRPIAY